MHEWLSGGVSPCQGEGRGFESRLVLSMIQKRRYPLDISFFCMFTPCRARTVRMSTLRSGRRSRTSPGRSATSRALKEIEKESSDGWLFFLCSSPAGVERFEVYAPLRSSQQDQILVKHKIAWYDKTCSEMLVDGINPILLMTRRKVGSLLTS